MRKIVKHLNVIFERDTIKVHGRVDWKPLFIAYDRVFGLVVWAEIDEGKPRAEMTLLVRYDSETIPENANYLMSVLNEGGKALHIYIPVNESPKMGNGTQVTGT